MRYTLTHTHTHIYIYIYIYIYMRSHAIVDMRLHSTHIAKRVRQCHACYERCIHTLDRSIHTSIHHAPCQKDTPLRRRLDRFARPTRVSYPKTRAARNGGSCDAGMCVRVCVCVCEAAICDDKRVILSSQQLIRSDDDGIHVPSRMAIDRTIRHACA